MDLIWPETPEFTSVAERFTTDGLKRMLQTVWDGYDGLVAEFLFQIDIDAAEEEIERGITMILVQCINTRLSGLEPYFVMHGPYENETRKAAPAQPPQYDIAFILNGNHRVMWPLEAKVMRTPRNVAPYVRDISNEFLTGRYAPFSKSAAMIGYLLSGRSEDTVLHIENRLGVKLNVFPPFHPEYTHHVSVHYREVQKPGHVGSFFQCHHMIMPMHKN